MNTLFVIATPIGNLGDVSVRASELLRTVTVVAAEDTRVTSKLLASLGASPRVLSYHEDSPDSRTEELLTLLDACDVALVTDAGTPGLSDPGARLVSATIGRGHAVTPIPGPSAVTALLSVSGFSGAAFFFAGYLPRARAERRRVLESMAGSRHTTVCFEAPHRLRDSLEDIKEMFGDRRLVIGRELTKLYEEIYRGDAAAATMHFTEPRGEFVIAFEAAPEPTAAEGDESVLAAIERLRERGLSGRTLVDAVVGETGATRSRVYRLTLGKRSQ